MRLIILPLLFPIFAFGQKLILRNKTDSLKLEIAIYRDDIRVQDITLYPGQRAEIETCMLCKYKVICRNQKGAEWINEFLQEDGFTNETINYLNEKPKA